jgi:hypothetical protein
VKREYFYDQYGRRLCREDGRVSVVSFTFTLRRSLDRSARLLREVL